MAAPWVQSLQALPVGAVVALVASPGQDDPHRDVPGSGAPPRKDLRKAAGKLLKALSPAQLLAVLASVQPAGAAAAAATAAVPAVPPAAAPYPGPPPPPPPRPSPQLLAAVASSRASLAAALAAPAANTTTQLLAAQKIFVLPQCRDVLGRAELARVVAYPPTALPSLLALLALVAKPRKLLLQYVLAAGGDSKRRQQRVGDIVVLALACGAPWVLDELVGAMTGQVGGGGGGGGGPARSGEVHAELLGRLLEGLQSPAHRQTFPTGSGVAFRARWSLAVSRLERRVRGTSVTLLTTQSVLGDVATLDLSGLADVPAVVAICRGLVGRLGNNFRTLEPSQSPSQHSQQEVEQRRSRSGYMVGAFFTVVSKAYERVRELGGYLVPLRGWTTTTSGAGGLLQQQQQQQQPPQQQPPRQRVTVISERIWLDLISSGIDEAWMPLVTDGVGPNVPIWEGFYRAACLCDDETDAGRIIWRLADDLAAADDEEEEDQQKAINLSAAPTALSTFRKHVHDPRFAPKLMDFCALVVSSLRQATSAEAAARAETATAAAAAAAAGHGGSSRDAAADLLFSIRGLTKLLGCLGEANPRAWACLARQGALRLPVRVLLHQQRLQDTECLNAIAAIDRFLGAGIDRTVGYDLVLVAADLADAMTCRALAGVLFRSAKFAAEVMDALTGTVVEAWDEILVIQAERARRGMGDGGRGSGGAAVAARVPAGRLAENMAASLVAPLCRQLVRPEGTLWQALDDARMGPDCAERLADLVIWCVSSQSHAALSAALLRADEGFADLVWEALRGTRGGRREQDKFLETLQQLTFKRDCPDSGPCCDLRRGLLDVCPLLNRRGGR